MTLATLDFRTEFAVDMTCQNCVNSVQAALRNIQGVERYDIDLENKRVTIVGRTPPSQLFSALKSTNRQVIVRGTSSLSTFNQTHKPQAAVSILESPLPLPSSLTSTSNPLLPSTSTLASQPQSQLQNLPGLTESSFTQKVFGIARFVQIAPRLILMDLTLRLPPASTLGLAPAQRRTLDVYISKTGDLGDPPRTTGGSMVGLGKVVLDEEGFGDMFREVEGELWEWIGRGCVVQADKSGDGGEKRGDGLGPGKAEGKGETKDMGEGTRSIFAGVVARSAGVWGNEKTVCACSGRTMWEEGREMEKKSSL